MAAERPLCRKSKVVFLHNIQMFKCMKRILFVAVTMLLMSTQMVQAQTKVLFDGYGALEIKFKRCYVEGTSCVVDILLTNNTKKDLSPCICVGDGLFATDLSAYDDEGNTYDKYSIKGTIGNTDFGGYTHSTGCATLPAGTSIKVRFRIKEFDEFATKITTLMCNFRGVSDDSYGKAGLKITNIPVMRPE